MYSVDLGGHVNEFEYEGEYAVRAEAIHKRYGERKALDGFDLAVRKGTVHGLLGPNGAGKTTAVRVLATLLRYDSGRAEVAGVDVARDPRRVRGRIGLTGQYAAVDELLTGRQNLEMFGRLFHLGGPPLPPGRQARGTARR
jgi:ABC-2 type transport system ATP-binding protein